MTTQNTAAKIVTLAQALARGRLIIQLIKASEGSAALRQVAILTKELDKLIENPKEPMQ